MSELSRSTLPAADAAQIVMGARGRQFITVLSLISLAPLLNAIMMIGSRILFAMGRDRMLPSRAAAVNAGGTPSVAMIVTTLVAVVLIGTGTFQRLVAMASFYLALNYFACCVALIVLRRREPATPRPFRAWGYPWSAVIVAAGAAVFVAAALKADAANSLGALALLAVGLVGRMASLTGRGPVWSDGWFTSRPRTTIVVEPPPSRLRTESRRSRPARRCISAKFMPRLNWGWRPSMVISQMAPSPSPMIVRGWRVVSNPALICSSAQSVIARRWSRSRPAPLTAKGARCQSFAGDPSIVR
jgi:hypothetical protein